MAHKCANKICRHWFIANSATGGHILENTQLEIHNTIGRDLRLNTKFTTQENKLRLSFAKMVTLCLGLSVLIPSQIPVPRGCSHFAQFRCFCVIVIIARTLTYCGLCEAMQGYRPWSALVQVMVCCLTAPSHYTNFNLLQYWPIISKVLWHQLEGNWIENAQDFYRRILFL